MPSETIYLPQGMYDDVESTQGDEQNISQRVQELIATGLETEAVMKEIDEDPIELMRKGIKWEERGSDVL